MILLEEKVSCCYHPHWLTYRKRADRHHTSPLEESSSPELSFAIENRIATAWNKELRLTRTDRTQKGEKGLVTMVEL